MTSSFSNLHGVVVGLGSIGNRHLNNCLSLGIDQLTVVRRPESNSHFEAAEGVQTVHSLADALARKPDFVIVCNPSHLHAETAIQCLEANTHVLIEKPLGREFGSAEQQLAKIAKQSDRICAMAYCMRYHLAYQAAYQCIRDNQIGRCLYAKAWFEGYLPDWHPWEDYKQSYAGLKEQGGGVLRTLDHEMDFLNWVLGPAESATGFAINTNGIGIEADDLAMYQLRHPTGAHSQVTTAFCRKPQSRGFEFVGSKGVLSFRMEQGKLLKITHDTDGTTEIVDVANYDINQMYVELVKEFLESVQQGRPSSSLPTLEHGINCLKVFNSIVETNSCQT